MENNFKGTKGRWLLDRMDIYADGGEEFIEGNVICLAPEGLEKSMVSWQFNAKLIACAPEMLVILEKISHGEEHVGVMEIRELIKKATEL